MKEEVWKPIPGHAGYEVSDQGRVRSFVRGGTRYLRLRLDTRGYYVVTLGRAFQSKKVHHLVLLAFVGPRPKGYQCDHINTIRTDNRLENLHWVTPSGNQCNPVTRQRQRTAQKTSRQVFCAETGETFISINEAARKLNLRRSDIQSVLHGRKRMKTAHGLHFRFVEDAE